MIKIYLNEAKKQQNLKAKEKRHLEVELIEHSRNCRELILGKQVKHRRKRELA